MSTSMLVIEGGPVMPRWRPNAAMAYWPSLYFGLFSPRTVRSLEHFAKDAVLDTVAGHRGLRDHCHNGVQ